MKNCKLLFASLLMLCAITSFAQTGLNFQGVARNTAGAIIALKTIALKLSIIKSTSTGVVEYSEIRNVATNAHGVFTIVIGSTGAKSATGNFNIIDWTLKPKFIKIEMDSAGGTAFTTMGTQEFQYVAYARYSESVKAENIRGTVPVTLGGTGSL